jgi:hypothetical protein
MKARLLKKILSDTKYDVHFKDNSICIGSPMCSDLISLDIKTFKMRYAMDTFNEGPSSLKNRELIFISDKLEELIDNGNINKIIQGQDKLDSPIPVYKIHEGNLIETFTDCYGYPNITIDGILMYDNEYFKTKEEAIQNGIEDNEYLIGSYNSRVKEKELEIARLNTDISVMEQYILKLKLLL